MAITNSTLTTTDRKTLEAERRALLGRLCVTSASQFGSWSDECSVRLRALDAILDGTEGR